MRVEVIAFGTKQWSDSLQGMALAARHPRPFFKEQLIPDMERIEQQLFASGGRRGGGSWAALKPETIARKVKAGNSPRINIATGTLLYTLEDSSAKAEGAVRRIVGYRLDFGSRAPGAAQSQKYRPIIHFTKFDRRRWALLWARYIVRFGRRV